MLTRPKIAKVKSLMIQATGSNAGKSLFVAGLARLLQRRGLRVAPFKPQNMANNAAVAIDGGEIARAQALQCIACRCDALSDMNPVLLKPQNDGSSQLIVQGKATGSVRARDYPRLRERLLGKVRASYHRLAQKFEVIIVEGAGSPAEVNLRAGDIANMGFATAEQVPVLILADIERGGSIAALCGTHQLLEPRERALVKGYAINKFRGDVALFNPALEVISQRTGWRSVGVVTWCERLRELPAEDSLDLKSSTRQSSTRQSSGEKKSGEKNVRATCRVVALRCPYMANADDLDPLLLDENFAVRLLEAGTPIPSDSHVVLLLGSKSVLADLAFLREQGWDIDLLAHRRRGGVVFGICGGYQMLGLSIEDAKGLEGTAGKKPALALLNVVTEITQGKKLLRTEGIASLPKINAKINASATSRAARREDSARAKVLVVGYEMHNGETRVETSGRRAEQAAIPLHAPANVLPWLSLPGLSLPDGREGEIDASPLDIKLGAVSADGYVLGCYLHGIFASNEFRRAFYQYAKPQHSSSYSSSCSIPCSSLSEAGSPLADGVALADGWRGNLDYAERIEQVLDIWADHIASCCDIEFILSLLNDGISDSLGYDGEKGRVSSKLGVSN